MWSRLVLVAVLMIGQSFASKPAHAVECLIGNIFSGTIDIEPMRDAGAALIKYGGMDGKEPFGSVRGMLRASREGIIVLNRDGARIGVIDPKTGKLIDDDEKTGCSRALFLKPATPSAGILINFDTPIGTYKGRLPH